MVEEVESLKEVTKEVAREVSLDNALLKLVNVDKSEFSYAFTNDCKALKLNASMPA